MIIKEFFCIFFAVLMLFGGVGGCMVYENNENALYAQISLICSLPYLNIILWQWLDGIGKSILFINFAKGFSLLLSILIVILSFIYEISVLHLVGVPWIFIGIVLGVPLVFLALIIGINKIWHFFYMIYAGIYSTFRKNRELSKFFIQYTPFDHAVEEFEQFKKTAPGTFVFILIVIIVAFGFYGILNLFFDDMEINAVWAGGLGLVIVGYCSEEFLKQKEEMKRLKQAVMIFRSIDKRLLSKLEWSNPGNYSRKRDIVYSLILEKMNYFKDFKDFNKKERFMDNPVIIEEKSKVYEQVKKLVDENFIYKELYREMNRLDEIVLSHLPEGCYKRYLKQIYYLRLNLLEMVRPYFEKGGILIIEDSNEERERPLSNFLNFCLNLYYIEKKREKYSKSCINYKERLYKYDAEELKEYFEQRIRTK